VKLYGTTTSPFVRRVRVVAAELGVAIERIDTATDEGQAALRRVSPIRKVPVAELDGRLLYDSRTIIDWLVTTRGWGTLAPPRDRWADANTINAIDAALDSAIQVFYLRRDGLDVATLAHAERQRDRIAAIFDWLDGELAAGRLGAAIGLAEISLGCALDWMEFRDAYRVGERFGGLRATLATLPSFATSGPP
jgi:glutathione S-transferase